MDTQYFTTDKELEFVGIFERHVQRDGWLNLLKHLKVETDFFVAQRTSPLITALHLADMMASWFDETSYE